LTFEPLYYIFSKKELVKGGNTMAVTFLTKEDFDELRKEITELKDLIERLNIAIMTGFRDKIMFFCPHCEKWTYGKYDDKEKIWVCKHCGKVPL